MMNWCTDNTGWLRRTWPDDGTRQWMRRDGSGLLIERVAGARDYTLVHRPNNATGEPRTVVSGPFKLLQVAKVSYVLHAARNFKGA